MTQALERRSSLAALPAITATVSADEEADRRAVAALDVEYQAAVKRNDWRTMDRILHPQYQLVLGNGAVVMREELLDEARARAITYEVQDEEPGTQTVRLWQDTAVVTALLHIKGLQAGNPFDRRLWFSDTYVRTRGGWRYAFAQASMALPKG